MNLEKRHIAFKVILLFVVSFLLSGNVKLFAEHTSSANIFNGIETAIVETSQNSQDAEGKDSYDFFLESEETQEEEDLNEQKTKLHNPFGYLPFLLETLDFRQPCKKVTKGLFTRQAYSSSVPLFILNEVFRL